MGLLKILKMRFYKTSVEEQETLINIDYFHRKVIVYTSQKETFKRIKCKFGEPDRIFTTKGQISGAEWTIPFGNRKMISGILSRPLLIGNRK
mgnify:CR=1 FL=1